MKNSQPIFRLGNITNHGEVWAFLYNYSVEEWYYKLVSDISKKPIIPIYKKEDELELIEEGRQIPQSKFKLGDDLQGKGVVIGVYYHPLEQSFANHLAKSGIQPRYINWIPERGLTSK